MKSLVTRRLQRQFLTACEGITTGRLRLVTPEGHRHDFGTHGPEAELHLHDWAVAGAVAARGDIGFGEAHVAGLWDSPCVETLTRVALDNFDRIEAAASPGPLQRLACQFPEDADPLHGRRDEVRLVGRMDGALPGVDTDPSASQTAGAALVVAHLQWGPRPSAEPDANTALQIDPQRRTRGVEPSVEELLEDELESDY